MSERTYPPVLPFLAGRGLSVPPTSSIRDATVVDDLVHLASVMRAVANLNAPISHAGIRDVADALDRAAAEVATLEAAYMRDTTDALAIFAAAERGEVIMLSQYRHRRPKERTL